MSRSVFVPKTPASSCGLMAPAVAGRSTWIISRLATRRMRCLGCPETAALDDLGLLLVGGDEVVRRSQGAFQLACLLHHMSPIGRNHGELVIGTFAPVVVGKMPLNHA